MWSRPQCVFCKHRGTLRMGLDFLGPIVAVLDIQNCCSSSSLSPSPPRPYFQDLIPVNTTVSWSSTPFRWNECLHNSNRFFKQLLKSQGLRGEQAILRGGGAEYRPRDLMAETCAPHQPAVFPTDTAWTLVLPNLAISNVRLYHRYPCCVCILGSPP